jgi:hypothetical protein
VVAKASKFGRDQLVEFRWELAIGDDTLTEYEIAALAEAKAPLIRLRGQWVAVDSEQLRRGLEFLARKPMAMECLQRHQDPGTGPTCCCARCRWSATGSGRRRASVQACGSTRTTAVRLYGAYNALRHGHNPA